MRRGQTGITKCFDWHLITSLLGKKTIKDILETVGELWLLYLLQLLCCTYLEEFARIKFIYSNHCLVIYYTMNSVHLFISLLTFIIFVNVFNSLTIFCQFNNSWKRTTPTVINCQFLLVIFSIFTLDTLTLLMSTY